MLEFFAGVLRGFMFIFVIVMVITIPLTTAYLCWEAFREWAETRHNNSNRY